MSDLKRFLLGGNSPFPFTEPFNTTLSYQTPGATISNIYNNWTWYSEWNSTWDPYTYNQVPAQINGSALVMNSMQGGNTAMVRLTRSLEGYNTHRPFKCTFSYMHNPYSSDTYMNYSDVVVSIGGNSSLTGTVTEPYGLNFHSRISTPHGNFFTVNNNGTTIGTPYSGLASGTIYYAHTFYDGTNIKVTLNTSSADVTSYDYSYPVTDRTQLSPTLMVYLYAQGYGDYNGGVQFYDITELLY